MNRPKERGNEKSSSAQKPWLINWSTLEALTVPVLSCGFLLRCPGRVAGKLHRRWPGGQREPRRRRQGVVRFYAAVQIVSQDCIRERLEEGKGFVWKRSTIRSTRACKGNREPVNSGERNKDVCHGRHFLVMRLGRQADGTEGWSVVNGVRSCGRDMDFVFGVRMSGFAVP